MILILGKELRVDPARGRRELQARAAGAAALWRRAQRRGEAARVLTLEALMRGQDTSGSALVRTFLRELGVPDGAVHAEERTCSTREEVVRGLELLRALNPDPGAEMTILTARYHLARARRLFAEHGAPDGGPIRVIAPEALWRMATAQERAWMAAGVPDAAATQAEARQERILSLAEALIRPMPKGWRARAEIAAGRWWRVA